MPASPASAADVKLEAARALWQRNEVAEAEAILREAHGNEPAREDTATLLAEVLRSQGRLSAASQVLHDACRANAFEATLCVRAARFAQQCDRHDIARAICDEALASGGATPGLLLLAGHLARESGDFAAARAHYLAALDAGVDLERNHVLGALAHTRRYVDPADREIARFAAHFADTRCAPRSRASAGFALAKAQDDLGDYAAAANTLRRANAMVRAARPWDAAAWRRFVAARQGVPAAPASTTAARDFVPVFVVGMPRTGTTLTATLLVRTIAAHDRGELRALRFIADRLIAGEHLASPAALTEAANLYRALAVQDDEKTTWYVDQDPLNFRYLDVAAAMFPQARVIHLRRDRRDTALSLWSQDFAHPDMAFASEFADMAAFMRGHDDLMQHWKATLRVPVHHLDYEMLVSDPGATIARLRDFIGAPAREPGAGAESFGESAPVQSASVWQARQPVYSSSAGRWRHYAPYVPELAQFGERH